MPWRPGARRRTVWISQRLQQAREEAGISRAQMKRLLADEDRRQSINGKSRFRSSDVKIIYQYENPSLDTLPWEYLDLWARITNKPHWWFVTYDEELEEIRRALGSGEVPAYHEPAPIPRDSAQREEMDELRARVDELAELLQQALKPASP